MKGRTEIEQQARDRADVAREEAIWRCRTCTNKVSKSWFTQCDSCIAQNISIEDHEAAEAIYDRVMAGLCQNCGEKEGCTCTYVG